MNSKNVTVMNPSSAINFLTYISNNKLLQYSNIIMPNEAGIANDMKQELTAEMRNQNLNQFVPQIRILCRFQNIG